MSREIHFPKLTGYQKEVWDFFDGKKGTGDIAVIVSSRQVGKSFFCLLKLIEVALRQKGSVSAIFEPTLNNSRNMFKQITNMLNGSGLVTTANAQILELEFINGSRILFKSTEQQNRGFTISGILILDECAYLDDEEIYTILPLASAHNAEMCIVSTPFVQEGYFYDMYMIGVEGNNPHIKLFDWAHNKETEKFLTAERKAFYKATMSPQKYHTEVEGEFLVNDGLLFVGIDKCIGQAGDNKVLYIGIDFAAGGEGDYTVLSAVNGKGEMIGYWRRNNLSPLQQIEWLYGVIEELNKKYDIRSIYGEKNSLGVVYIDSLNRKLSKLSLQILEWVTTNDSKQDLVTTIQIAFENQDITIPNDAILLNELKKYQATINQKTKKISYNAINGNDDIVMSLMFAYYSYKKSFGSYRISFA